MKRSNSTRMILYGICLLCVAVLIFAGVHVNTYHAPVRAPLTQQTIQQQLATTQQTTKPKPTKTAGPTKPSVAKVSPQPSSVLPSKPTQELPNTGAGNVIAIALVSACIGYGSCYTFLRIRTIRTLLV